jgi:hypothetical protein
MARGGEESGDRFGMRYATGYGVRVHILLPDQRNMTYCGKRVYSEWSSIRPPTETTICKNCVRANKKENT